MCHVALHVSWRQISVSACASKHSSSSREALTAVVGLSHALPPPAMQVQPYFVDDAVLCADSGADTVAGACFLLTRSKPIPAVRYNTLAQLYAYASSRDFAQASHREVVIVTLDFTKGPPLCTKSGAIATATGIAGFGGGSGITAGAAWVSMIDTFHHAATSCRNMRWVLTGDAQPEGCLAERWRPWAAAFTTAASPRDALTSNRRPFDRYAMLSDPADADLWETFASAGVNYGKFAHTDYPYVLWAAPGLDQSLVQSYLDLYEGGSAHRCSSLRMLTLPCCMFSQVGGSS